MNCAQTKDWLHQNLTRSGLALPGEIRQHIDACQECAEYYDDLLGLHEILRQLDQIALTTVEERDLMRGIEVTLEKVVPTKRLSVPGRWLKIMARPAVAIAAIILIALSVWQIRQPTVSFESPIVEFDIEGMGSDRILSVFLDDEWEEIPTMIDETTLIYLTERISSFQAGDILDNVTDEEVEWLVKNLEMEI